MCRTRGRRGSVGLSARVTMRSAAVAGSHPDMGLRRRRPCASGAYDPWETRSRGPRRSRPCSRHGCERYRGFHTRNSGSGRRRAGAERALHAAICDDSADIRGRGFRGEWTWTQSTTRACAHSNWRFRVLDDATRAGGGIYSANQLSEFAPRRVVRWEKSGTRDTT